MFVAVTASASESACSSLGASASLRYHHCASPSMGSASIMHTGPQPWAKASTAKPLVFAPFVFAPSYTFVLHAIYTSRSVQWRAPCWKACKKDSQKDCRTAEPSAARARKAAALRGLSWPVHADLRPPSVDLFRLCPAELFGGYGGRLFIWRPPQPCPWTPTIVCFDASCIKSSAAAGVSPRERYAGC